jgi:RNA polymerase sigma-70 factor (ECF subfamily)
MERDEAAILKKLDEGHRESAMSLALTLYGPEVYGFVRNLMRDDAEAEDAYATFCEDMWKGLAAFRGESSFRTWAYTLARHACERHRRRVDRARPGPTTDVADLASALRAGTRSETRPYLRSEMKIRVAALRSKLASDDRTLLTLRIDRDMAWNDIALVMITPEGERDERAVLAMAAVCRKRFERAKARLRKLAFADGLLAEP